MLDRVVCEWESPRWPLRCMGRLGCIALAGVVVLWGVAAVAGAQTKPTTSVLTVTGADPYSTSCTVYGPQIPSRPGLTGMVTFSDTTDGQALGTASLGTPTQLLFGPAVTVPLNSFQPQSVTSGDFNGDGITDFAMVRPSDTGSIEVQVLLGNGDGTFQAPVVTNTSAANLYFNYVGGIVAGDFNGDGKLDLAVADTIDLIGTGSYVSVLLGNGDGTFQTPVNAASTLMPSLMAVGYFNADKNLDLVVGSEGSGSLAVLLGNGDGTFQAPISAGASGSITGIVTGDFNHDGFQDVAAVMPDGQELEVVLGNGDGTFQLAHSYSLLFGSQGSRANLSVATGDFNGDGYTDLVVGSAATGEGNLALLLNAGSGEPGTFQTPQYFTLMSETVWSIAVGDFNGDGNLDVAGTGGSKGGVLLGNGNGTFQTPYLGLAEPASGFTTLLTGNFNEEGPTDLAVWGTGDLGGLYVIPNRQWTASAGLSNVLLNNGNTEEQLLQCSYSGDSNYSASSSSTVPVYIPAATIPVLSLASGTYNEPESLTITDTMAGASIYYTTDGSTPGPGSTLYTGPISLSRAETVIAVADANGYSQSGEVEGVYTLQAATPLLSLPAGIYPPGTTVTIRYGPTNGSVYYTTDGTPPSASSTPYTGPIALSGTETIQAIAVAPMLLSATSAAATYTVAPATPTPVITPPSAAGTSAVSVTITDSNSAAPIYYTTDGATPTAKSTLYSGAFTVYPTAFPIVTIKAIAIASGDASSTVATARYTFMASSSVLTVSGSDPYTLTCTVGGPAVAGISGPTGTVTFTDATTKQTLGTAPLGAATDALAFDAVYTPMESTSKDDSIAIATKDFNGDGVPDIAALIGGKYLYLYLGDGDGTFREPQMVSLTNLYNIKEWANLAAGDFNGDGNLDLALTSAGGASSLIAILYGDGAGGFSAPTGIPLTGEATGIIVGDFNSDGTTDIAATLYSNVEIYLGSTDAPMQYAGKYVIGQNPGSAVADVFVTGNPYPDLAYPRANGITLLEGKGDGTFPTSVKQPLNFTPGWMAAADFNHDGKLDLAMTDNAGNNVWILLGNGDGTFQYPSEPAFSGEVGRIVAADFTGNDIPDLAFIGPGELLNVALGNGNGTFALGQSYPVSGDFIILKRDDLNGDGREDLLTISRMGTTTIAITAALNYLQAAASATLSNATVIAGRATTHNLECSYPGDSNYPGSISVPVAETYPQVATPVFSLLVGNYATAQTVSISDATPGATIYYTNDGSTPTASSMKYTGPITVSSTVTLKAIAGAKAATYSPVSEVTYTLTDPPAFSVPGGTYSAAQSVRLTDPTSGSVIYYTTDSTTPGKTSTQYTTPISIVGNVTLNAVAVAPGNLFSPVATAIYHTPLAATTTTLKASAAGGTVNQQITLTATVAGTSPTGSVTFSAGGKMLGTATLSSGVATLQTSFGAAGTYSVTAAYSGDNSDAASTSTAISMVIALNPTTTSLAASAATGDVNQTIALTATVAGTSPTGSVTFSAGSQKLGTATLGAGVATLQTSFATAGAYSVTAAYSGDAANASSTSAATMVTIVAASFTVGANPASQTISPGQSATYTFTVTPAGGYTGTVNFACGTLPSAASCSFSQKSVVVTSSTAATTTLTISTTATTTSRNNFPAGPLGRWKSAGTLALAGLLGVALGGRRMRRWSRWMQALAGALLLAAMWLPLAGCGGGGNGGSGGHTIPGTPAGTYSVSVTASDSAGGPNNSVQVTLVVQ